MKQVKHKAWSLKSQYICEHIQKYLTKIKNNKNKKYQIRECSKLFNYLYYKIDFINANDKLKITTLQKGVEVKNDCNKFINTKLFNNNNICITCIESINRFSNKLKN